MEYQLELKQIVEYPRCRIYRQFIRTLMDDRSIRVSGGSGLFYFAVLCAQASSRPRKLKIGKSRYEVNAGEGMFSESEMMSWFKAASHEELVEILFCLCDDGLIDFTPYKQGRYIKFKILSWQKSNTVSERCATLEKDTDFFFLPMTVLSETLYTREFSESDIILDLWMNAIYNDERVQDSDIDPVVYLRTGTGTLLLQYYDLSCRWGLTAEYITKFLSKFEKLDYLSIITPLGQQGVGIFLKGYLASMFKVSDVIIDKDEIPMALSMKVSLPENALYGLAVEASLMNRIFIANNLADILKKQYLFFIVQKVADLLSAQGVKCCSCKETIYNLSLGPIAHKEITFECPVDAYGFTDKPLILTINCGRRSRLFAFSLTLTKEGQHGHLS